VDSITVFAQAVDPSVFAAYGLPGAIILWFALRAEKRLDNIAEVVRDLAKSILLDVVSRPAISEAVRDEAKQLIDKIRPGRRE